MEHFNLLKDLLTVFGLLPLLGLIYIGFSGVLRVLCTLGRNIACRKIGIFTDTANYPGLKKVLNDSSLIREKNIILVTKDNIDEADNCDIFLVDWAVFQDKFEQVKSRKTKKQSMIVYAVKQMDKDDFNSINEIPRSLVTQFRGRLLNDVMGYLITHPA